MYFFVLSQLSVMTENEKNVIAKLVTISCQNKIKKILQKQIQYYYYFF